MPCKLPAVPALNRRAPRTTRDLTAAQRSVLKIMRENQFGRLENVPVQGGQPVLDRGVKVVRVARLGGESVGMTVPCTDEFELKRAVCDLFDELARLGNGTVVKLEFKHGLPFSLETVATAISEDPPGASARS